MGLKKAYDELTDTPEFSDGLSVATDESIYDGRGNQRIVIDDKSTEIRGEDGLLDNSIRVDSNFEHVIETTEGLLLEDSNTNKFTAIEYSTSSSSPGTLELTNANLVTASSNEFTIYGDVSEDPEPGFGGGLATTNGNGSGFWDRNGEPVFLGRDTPTSNAIHFILGKSGVDRGEKIRLTPDTLELTNAVLDVQPSGSDIRARFGMDSGGNLSTLVQVGYNTSNYIETGYKDINGTWRPTLLGSDSGDDYMLLKHNDGEIIAEDGSGNQTTLT